MKKYVLTSPKFEGAVILGINDFDRLVYYSNESEMNVAQINWLLSRLPVNEESILLLAKVIEGTLEEVPQDISFDTFWDTYGKKVNAKRCKPLYAALSDEEKLLAIIRISQYFKYCKRTGFRGIYDPDKYLRNRYFETDWSKEK